MIRVAAPLVGQVARLRLVGQTDEWLVRVEGANDLAWRLEFMRVDPLTLETSAPMLGARPEQVVSLRPLGADPT